MADLPRQHTYIYTNTSWSNLKIYKFPFCSSVRPSLTKGLDRTGKRLKRTSDKQVEREESNMSYMSFLWICWEEEGFWRNPPKIISWNYMKQCLIVKFHKEEISKYFACNMLLSQVLEARNFAYLFEISFKRNFICFICNIMFQIAWYLLCIYKVDIGYYI